MNIVLVIFGASGFVGRNLMDHLYKYDPMGVDKESPRKDYLGKYKKFLQSDVFSLKSVPSVNKPFYVINLMAELGSPDLKKNIRNNLDSVEHLYSIIKNTNAECLGVVHFSSISAERGASYYGKTKMDAEEIVKSKNIPYVILQSEMIVGKGARSIEKLKKGLNFFPFISFLPKGGEVTRYPIDIQDVCETTRLIIVNDLFDNMVYHLISEKTTMKKLSKKYTNNIIFTIPKFLLLSTARILEFFFKNPMFTYDNAVGVCSDTKLKLDIVNTDVINKKLNG